MTENTDAGPDDPEDTTLNTTAAATGAFSGVYGSAGDAGNVEKPVASDFDVEPSIKRRKISPEKDEKPKPPIFIKPAPLPLNIYHNAKPHLSLPSPTGQTFAATDMRQRSLPLPRRPSTLNLKNYPTNPHPTGLGIWVLQKVEQKRKDRPVPAQAAYGNGTHWQSPSHSPQAAYRSYGFIPQNQTPQMLKWQAQETAQPAAAGYSSHDEFDATRRQSQRDRKSKQRSENWAKNKENDVVARAKLEAKKQFPAESSEAEKQEWIEERIKEDFERLLNRLAAQFQREIGHLGPFQTGFADDYFHVDRWPPGYDQRTLRAGKLIADVLPGLTESRVTERSLAAATALIAALQNSSPQGPSFHAGIRLLSENREVLLGIDKVLAYLFAPKAGQHSSRKRSTERLVDSQSSALISTQQAAGPSILHWKETATSQSSYAPVSSTQTSNLPFAQAYADFSNSRVKRAQSYNSSWTGYPAHAPSQAPAWPPYNYFPSVGSSSSPLYSHPYFPVAAYSSNATQQTAHFPQPNKVSLPGQFGQSPKNPGGHPGGHPGTSGLQQTSAFAGRRPQSQQQETVLEPPSDFNIQPAPGTAAEPLLPAPDSTLSTESIVDRPASTSQGLLDHENLKLSTSTGAESLSQDGNSPSIAPATPATPGFGSNITSPFSTTDTDGAVEDNTKEVFDVAQSGMALQSPTASDTSPVSRFPARERKPTARAIAANLTPSLLSNAASRSDRPAIESPSKKATLSVTGPVDKGTRVSPKDKTPQPSTQQNETSSKETPTVGEVMPSQESDEIPQLRSSGRERKPTAKALALGTASKSKKRAVSTSGSPPPAKAAKVTSFVTMSPFVSSSVAASSGEDPLQSANNAINLAGTKIADMISDGLVAKTSNAASANVVPKITLHVTQKEFVPDQLEIKASEEQYSTNPPGVKAPSQTEQTRVRSSEMLRETTSSLLAFAAIAAQWSDSDDDDDDIDPADAERAFQERLAKELSTFPHLQKSPKQLSASPGARDEMMVESETTGVTGGKMPADSRSRKEPSRLSSMASKPRPHTIPDTEDRASASQPVAEPSKDNSKLQKHRYADFSDTQNSDKGPHSPRVAEESRSQTKSRLETRKTRSLRGGIALQRSSSGSQVRNSADTEQILEKLRTAARNRGLVIDNHMGREQILNKISEYDDELYHVLGSKQAHVPSGDRQAQTPRNPVGQVNPSTNSPLGGMITSIRSATKPTSVKRTQSRIDPRGLNGERPGGGTIINVQENGDGQNERKKAKEAESAQDGASSGRASPAVPVPGFKKGGQLLRFSQFRTR